nr:hypothetical protein [Tanacetum cinerariifolium]
VALKIQADLNEKAKRERERQEEASKVGLSLKHKSPKRQKVNDQDSEDNDEEYRKCLKVVLDDDKAIDYETLDVKSLIVNCYDLILWGDLKTLLESSEDDEI